MAIIIWDGCLSDGMTLNNKNDRYVGYVSKKGKFKKLSKKHREHIEQFYSHLFTEKALESK